MQRQHIIWIIFILLAVSSLVARILGDAPAAETSTSWSENPSEDLAKDYAEDEIADHAKAAPQPLPEHWSKLEEGLKQEASGNIAKAKELFKSISQKSAASLDARLAQLRILRAENAKAADIAEKLSSLEYDVRKARRTDLLPEIVLIRGMQAEASENFAEAAKLYREARELFSRTPTAEKARERQRQLMQKTLSGKPGRSIAEHLFEAELLLKERDLIPALQEVQLAKSQTTPPAKAYYETLLLEEEILRLLGRKEEADALLVKISSSHSEKAAELALKKLIQLSWNANDQNKALALIDSFEANHPQSSHIEEIRYNKGRILEEKGEFQEARAVYADKIDTPSMSLHKLLGIKQLAWLDLQSGDFLRATKNFDLLLRQASDTRESVLKLAKEAIPDSLRSTPIRTLRDLSRSSSAQAKEPILRELRELRAHAAYWKAHALSQMKAEEKKGFLSQGESQETHWKKVLEIEPLGYYGLMARRELPGTNSVSELLGKESKVLECTLNVNPVLEAQLLALASAPDETRRRYIQSEINWQFRDIGPAYDRAFTPTALPSEEELRSVYSRALLFSNYGLPHRAIELAQTFLQGSLVESLENIQPEPCLQALLRLGFPIPHLRLYSAASKSSGVPLSILLAISRTESHFDSFARSGKDARGLMQLLVSTAEMEGLPSGGDLYQPEVNIPLGAKHLQRLFADYGGPTPYAFAAYNAGLKAVERWRTRHPSLSSVMWTELISYPETRNYVKKVSYANEVYEALLNTNSAP